MQIVEILIRIIDRILNSDPESESQNRNWILYAFIVWVIGAAFMMWLTLSDLKGIPSNSPDKNGSGVGIYPLPNRELLTLILIIVFCILATVWFRSQSKTPLVKHNLTIPLKTYVTDILLICGISLGDDFRLNLMRPRNPLETGIKEFGFVATYNLEIIPRYDKITEHSPGVGDAYKNRSIVYLKTDQLDTSIDPNCKHLWCARLPKTQYVLNIDKTVVDITKDEIQKLKDIIEDIAGFFVHLKLDPLPILKCGKQ